MRLRLAALQYSSTVSVEHNFRDWQDLDVFQSRVASMTFIGHGTYSAYAITNATQVFTRETSASSLRVALLMTDGTDHPRSPSAVTAAAEAKQHNIRVFTIRLSGLLKDGPMGSKLRSIASAPPQQHVLSLADPRLDDRLFSELVICFKLHSLVSLQGEQGECGAAGKKGEQGARGGPGDQGPEGPSGSKGQQGCKEPQGFQVKAFQGPRVTGGMKVPRAAVDFKESGKKGKRESPLELVFVIDSSESVGPDNFELVKDFVTAIIDRVSVSQDASRIGVVVYSHVVKVVVSLELQLSQDEIKDAVRKMPYMGEGTFTGSAIHRANLLFQASRPGVRKVAVVLTDGNADERDIMNFEETAAEAHNEGIEVFTIGVMDKDDFQYEWFEAEMNVIASDPYEEHVYLIDDFRKLPTLESKLLNRICDQEDAMEFLPIFPSGEIQPEVLSTEFPEEENIQLELPTETVTALTPEPQGSRRVDKNLVDNEFPVRPNVVFASPGSRGQQSTEVASVVGPQTPADWLYEAVSTQAPVSPPPPPLTDSPVPDDGCSQPLDPGPCREYVVKWYYDREANACAQFWFGGCQGNANNYETEAKCRSSCVYT
ncbi:Collagen alpha-1(XXVIII) chain [Nibea albiflora]|uniref:Collagen alpha-1(XXVIII) chain n=1 Tax=Nibea albiflora TaxID=240163 RepID=A0ACB7EW15_NIBAL|nr:Collagen alpha-1(XXVIII) chain [Nibea albiflora]